MLSHYNAKKNQETKASENLTQSKDLLSSELLRKKFYVKINYSWQVVRRKSTLRGARSN